MTMTISRLGKLLRRPAPVVLAFLLLVTTGGFRPSEWTLCVEPDGRVHTELAGGDCASEDRAHFPDGTAHELAYQAAPVQDTDCGDCYDITGRSHGLRIREEIATPAVPVPLVLPNLLVTVGPTRGPARRTVSDLPNNSALIDRATGTIVLTC